MTMDAADTPPLRREVEIPSRRGRGNGTSPPRRVSRTVQDILRDMATAAPQRIWTTGLDELDRLLGGGVRSRQLTLVAGPPGTGKTALALDWARLLARSAPVLAVETEIEEEEAAARVAALLLDTTPDSIMRHETEPTAAAAAVQSEQDAHEGYPIAVMEADVSEMGDALEAIAAEAAAIRTATGHAPSVIVDYGQMLAVDNADQRRLGVSAIANGLRRLSRDLDVPVIVVSSVARQYYAPRARERLTDSDGREDPRTWLGSGKESGDLEFAAAVVLYLDVAVSQIDAQGWIPARIVVAKSRRGRVGFVGARLHGPTGRWVQDASAAAALGPARRDGEDDRRVLAVVTSRPGYVLRDLRSQVPGVGPGRVTEAVGRLLTAGVLEERDLVRANARGQRRATRVLVPPGYQLEEVVDA